MTNSIEEVKQSFENFNRRFHSENSYLEFIRDIEQGNYEKVASSEVMKCIDLVLYGSLRDIFESCIDHSTALYRARLIDFHESKDELQTKGIHITHDKMTGYNELNSIEPPIGFSNQGRANARGQSVFYAANERPLACAEIRPGNRDSISLAKFKVIAPSGIKVIDFHNERSFPKDESSKYSMAKFFTDIMFQFTSPVSVPTKYRASQYIADHIRKSGIDGISYRSMYNDGINYAIFNRNKSNIKYIESEIIINYSVSNILVAMDENCSESIATHPSVMFDKKNRIEQTIKDKMKAEIVNDWIFRPSTTDSK